MLDELNRAPEVRAERLAQIKAAIEAGTYETPEKLEAALSKLLDEIGFDNRSHERR
jgi:negative regulator of flagellin synthesis FlgM